MRILSPSFYISSHFFRDTNIDASFQVWYTWWLLWGVRKLQEKFWDVPSNLDQTLPSNNRKLTNGKVSLLFWWGGRIVFNPSFLFLHFYLSHPLPGSLYLVYAFWCNYLSCEEFIPPAGVKTHYNLEILSSIQPYSAQLGGRKICSFV